MPVVLPGEVIQTQHKTIKLGPGLQQFSDPEGKTSINVTRAGTLEQNAKGNQFWVEGNSRRVSPLFGRSSLTRSSYAWTKYVPAAQEPVIGIVSARQGEGWKVDIGSAHQASLDGLAFEGASRRNRPSLKVCFGDDLVGLRGANDVRSIRSFMPVFLSPIKTWNQSSNVSMRRHAKQKGLENSRAAFWYAAALKCPESGWYSSLTALAHGEYHSLLNPNYFLLPLLGSRFPLDTASGMNGRVWISAKEVKQIIVAARCIEAADPDGGGMDQNAIKKFIGTLDL